MKKRTTRRNVVSFYELSPEWQIEARSNLDDYAEEYSYFEPLDNDIPSKHILWDLSECMRVPKGERYNGVIGISNNSAMAVKMSDCGTQAVTWYLY